ncbi:hypothetical protein JXA84_07860 [candidate division WOR-3 bacterium]|nr:hypothetical protein [candidate division WOR-3 bacterium]
MKVFFVNFFLISMSVQLFGQIPPFQPRNSALFTLETDQSGTPKVFLLKCESVYLTSGSYGALEMNFSHQNENGETMDLSVQILYIDKFSIIYEKLENRFKTEHIDFPLVLTDSDFVDMYSVFENPIHSFFWLESSQGSEVLRREYLGNFIVSLHEIHFNGDSINIDFDFTADNYDNVYYAQSEISGRVKISGFQFGWKMVD